MLLLTDTVRFPKQKLKYYWKPVSGCDKQAKRFMEHMAVPGNLRTDNMDMALKTMRFIRFYWKNSKEVPLPYVHHSFEIPVMYVMLEKKWKGSECNIQFFCD